MSKVTITTRFGDVSTYGDLTTEELTMTNGTVAIIAYRGPDYVKALNELVDDLDIDGSGIKFGHIEAISEQHARDWRLVEIEEELRVARERILELEMCLDCV